MNNNQIVNYNIGPGAFVVSLLNNVSTTHDKNVTGLRLGLGLEENLGNHLALNVDYIYTNYGKVSTSTVATINGVDAIPILPNGFVANAHSDVTSHAMLIGLTYYFSPQRFFA